jgi:hypothetical protein
MLLSCLNSSNHKMNVTCSSETAVHFERTVWRYSPEDRNLQTNFFSYSRDCSPFMGNGSSIIMLTGACCWLHVEPYDFSPGPPPPNFDKKKFVFRLDLPSGLFLSDFQSNTLYAYLHYLMRTTCPAHFILHELIEQCLKVGLLLLSLFLLFI